MKSSKRWWDVWESRGLSAISALSSEYDETQHEVDRTMTLREAYIAEDYTLMQDHVEDLELRLRELRAGV